MSSTNRDCCSAQCTKIYASTLFGTVSSLTGQQRRRRRVGRRSRKKEILLANKNEIQFWYANLAAPERRHSCKNYTYIYFCCFLFRNENEIFMASRRQSQKASKTKTKKTAKKCTQLLRRRRRLRRRLPLLLCWGCIKILMSGLTTNEMCAKKKGRLRRVAAPLRAVRAKKNIWSTFRHEKCVVCALQMRFFFLFDQNAVNVYQIILLSPMYTCVCVCVFVCVGQCSRSAHDCDRFRSFWQSTKKKPKQKIN